MTPPAEPERRQKPAQACVIRALPAADSIWWLAGVAVAFTAAQLLFVPVRMGLSWDEVVYVSQLSSHAPAAFFDPPRARGIPLLVAPVELLTSSIAVLRSYLSVASGLGLFLALLAWRRQRPAWVLALAGVMLGGLWVAQYYGPMAMPDEWVAVTALAAVGCFLRVAEGLAQADIATRAYRGALTGLTCSLALCALIRPGDAVFLTLTLTAAILAVRAWRRWQLLAATMTGLLAGLAEWVIEAYLRFGGPLARLRAAAAEQGGFGLHLGVWTELRAVNGPTLCRPCTVGLRYPQISLWWMALPVLVTLGVLAARQAGRLRSSLLPAVCGLAVASPYLFLISYAAPRFLLPAYALLAIPVADGLSWPVTRIRTGLRPITTVAVVLCLGAQLLIQHLVLAHEVRGTVVFHNDYARIAAELRHLGLRPPCLVKGIQHIPIAFYAGCGSAGRPARLPGGGTDSERVAVLVHRRGGQPPSYARGWQRHNLTGTRILNLAAYLEPR